MGLPSSSVTTPVTIRINCASAGAAVTLRQSDTSTSPKTQQRKRLYIAGSLSSGHRLPVSTLIVIVQDRCRAAIHDAWTNRLQGCIGRVGSFSSGFTMFRAAFASSFVGSPVRASWYAARALSYSFFSR